MINKTIWCGLLQISSKNLASLKEGAYVNAAVLAENEHEAKLALARALSSHNYSLDSVEWELSPSINNIVPGSELDSISQLAHTTGEVEFSTFFTWNKVIGPMSAKKRKCFQSLRNKKR